MELMTTQQATAYLTLGPQTLAQWRYLRRGPRFIKLGERNVRYLRSDLDAWVESQCVDVAA